MRIKSVASCLLDLKDWRARVAVGWRNGLVGIVVARVLFIVALLICDYSVFPVKVVFLERLLDVQPCGVSTAACLVYL